MLSVTSPRAVLEAKVLLAIAIPAALLAVIYALILGVTFLWRHNFESRAATFTVLEKQFANGTLYVMTNIHTYQCRNSLAFWKWDAMETYASLEVGRTYTARVVGFRVGFLEYYPTILQADDLLRIILAPPEPIPQELP